MISVTESCTYADKLLQDISFQDSFTLDERHMSPHPSVEEEVEKVKKRHVMTKSSISNHISNIILNLKVSQVLVQEAERSLLLTESRMMENLCSSEQGIDEPDMRAGWRKRLPKAVGPPSSRYIPRVEIQETEEFCSAGEESLKRSEVLNS